MQLYINIVKLHVLPILYNENFAAMRTDNIP